MAKPIPIAADPNGGPGASPRPHKDRGGGRDGGDDGFGALVAQAGRANDAPDARERAPGRDTSARAAAASSGPSEPPGKSESSGKADRPQRVDARPASRAGDDAQSQGGGARQGKAADASASPSPDPGAKVGAAGGARPEADNPDQAARASRTAAAGLATARAASAADGRGAGDNPAQQTVDANAKPAGARAAGDAAARLRAGAGEADGARRQASQTRGRQGPRPDGEHRGGQGREAASRPSDAARPANGGAGRERAEDVIARFSGQRVSVSLSAKTVDGQAPRRVSGDTAIAAQVAASGEDGRGGRGERGRRAGDGGRDRTRADDARAPRAMAADTAARRAAARKAATQEAVAEMRAARTAARAAGDGAATAESASTGGSGDARRAAGRDGGAPTLRAASSPSQSFDPVMQTTQQAAGGSGQGADSPARAGEAQSPAQARPAPAPPVKEQVAVQIQRGLSQGQQRLNIRLQPPELGRIDVKLDVGDDGITRATLSIDQPETLDLLQRDARGLERALQNAGLKTDSNSLSFDLRGGDGREPGAGNGDADADGRDASRQDGEPAGAPPEDAGDVPAALRLSEDGLDIRV